MRRFGLLLAALLCLACGVAWADDFSLPGLEADSGAYARTLTSRFPAGGTPQARKAAEQAAAAAIRKQDWGAAAAAWETRIAQGDAAPAQWLALAEAQMRRTPPDATRALQAAWQNFSAAPAGRGRGAAAAADGRGAEGAGPSGAGDPGPGGRRRARARRPDDRQELDEARRAAGMLVRRVATEPEAEPPRACLDFTVAPVPTRRLPCRRTGCGSTRRCRARR